MDYRTLFLANIAFMTVYTVFACSLAWQNRKIKGFSLVAWGLAVGLVKVILQGMEGKIPHVFSALVANELYLLSFVLQMAGLRWFVDRSNPVRRWPLVLLALIASVYTVLYFYRVPYIANLLNGPVIVICGVTAWTLFQRGKNTFRRVSRWAAVFLLGEMIVSFYRAVLTNLHYAQPWKVVKAQGDSRWLYSLMAGMFFSTCVVMCDLWLFVTELQTELLEQARTDPLTGALNRRALQEEAAKEIARALRSGHCLSVLLVDVDNFKQLNDRYGHSAGDAALQYLVGHITRSLRKQDVVARTGGEEFMILLPDTSGELGMMIAERVRSSIAQANVLCGSQPVRLSVSVGVAGLDPHCHVFDTLMQHADEAMYTAKRLGRNRVVAYGREPDAEHRVTQSDPQLP